MAEEVKPAISETKVGNTKDEYMNKTEAQHAKAAKTNVPDTKAASSFLKRNRGAIALGAIGVGVAKSWVDGQDDDVLSSAGKGAKTGAVVAAAAYGSEHLLKTQTVQAMVRGEVVDISKSMRSKAEAEARMFRAGGKLGTAAKIGLGVFGVATGLDLANKAKERIDSAHIKAQQEQQIVDREKKKKEKQKKKSYGNINDGEIVFDMFNARSGHHKMGNAKFFS